MPQVNIFQQHLDLLRPKVSKSSFRRLEKIAGKVSDRFFRNRPYLDAGFALSEFSKMYASKAVYYLHDSMRLSDKETRFFNKLRARLNPRSIRNLANVGYTIHGYAKLCIASAPEELRDFSKQLYLSNLRGLSNLHAGNDFAAINIMHSIMQRAEKGETEFKILDAGAGTGGTLESLIHFAQVVAEHKGIDLSTLKIKFTCVDHNSEQINALSEKVKLLNEVIRKKRLPFSVEVIHADIVKLLKRTREWAQKGKTFDGVVASYMFHHLHDRDKGKVVKRLATLVRKGSVFAYNDCDGHSEKNQRYFNWVNFLHFSVFHRKRDARSLLKQHGFIVSDVHSPVVQERLQVLSNEFTGRILQDEKDHSGFCLVGVKK